MGRVYAAYFRHERPIWDLMSGVIVNAVLIRLYSDLRVMLPDLQVGEVNDHNRLGVSPQWGYHTLSHISRSPP